MTKLAGLAPRKHERIIDLVAAAGVDVSDWANFKGGAEKASTNPKYCYEWAFIEPGKLVVLNLWIESMEEQAGTISYPIRPRQLRKARSPQEATWIARKARMDEAIQYAYKHSLPVRVVICDGKMRNPADEKPKSSHVQKRSLDVATWAVTKYDVATGASVITRDAMPAGFIDQFALVDEQAGEAAKRSVAGEAFVRSPDVRAKVLERSGGRCEWCSQLGFRTADGRIFLETHHVVPLSEGGRDTVANVVAVCANHHRQAHHGVDRMEMRTEMLRRLSVLQPSKLEEAARKVLGNRQ